MLGILYRCRRSMWLEYWLNEHQGSDFPASVPSLAALPAWVGLEKDGCTPGLRHISVEDSFVATSHHLPVLPSGEAAISAEPAQRLRATSACRPPPAHRHRIVRCPPAAARLAAVCQASQRPPHQRSSQY
jgi:hypothetical protein